MAMPDITLENILDIILALFLVGVAWSVLTSRELFRGVVLFIVFGLVMALVWLRLGAPDIALAEAAIGSGLTSALLIEAVRQIEKPRRRDTEDQGAEREVRGPHGG